RYTSLICSAAHPPLLSFPTRRSSDLLHPCAHRWERISPTPSPPPPPGDALPRSATPRPLPRTAARIRVQGTPRRRIGAHPGGPLPPPKPATSESAPRSPRAPPQTAGIPGRSTAPPPPAPAVRAPSVPE